MVKHPDIIDDAIDTIIIKTDTDAINMCRELVKYAAKSDIGIERVIDLIRVFGGKTGDYTPTPYLLEELCCNVLNDREGMPVIVKQLKHMLVQRALAISGTKTEAVRRLGITRKILYYYLSGK